MKKNLGMIDRALRIALAIVVAVLYFTGNLSGLAAIILGVVAVVFVATSFVGVCPLYMAVGLSSLRKKSEA